MKVYVVSQKIVAISIYHKETISYFLCDDLSKKRNSQLESESEACWLEIVVSDASESVSRCNIQSYLNLLFLTNH